MDIQNISELVWIAVAVFLLGVSKGGIPVSNVVLPLLILLWPGREAEPAKAAVAFMLPLLSVMDVVAVTAYRKHIRWDRIVRLFPAAVLGIVAGSILFVARGAWLETVSDRGLKLCVGVLGLIFVAMEALPSLRSAGQAEKKRPGWLTSSGFGFVAGLTSTLAHAAGPVFQMFLLPQRLNKMQFAGTSAAFFFVVNLLKLIPFAYYGRIDREHLALGGMMLPVIPVGVLLGVALVKVTQPKHYMALLHLLLAGTSAVLVWKACTG